MGRWTPDHLEPLDLAPQSKFEPPRNTLSPTAQGTLAKRIADLERVVELLTGAAADLNTTQQVCACCHLNRFTHYPDKVISTRLRNLTVGAKALLITLRSYQAKPTP